MKLIASDFHFCHEIQTENKFSLALGFDRKKKTDIALVCASTVILDLSSF